MRTVKLLILIATCLWPVLMIVAGSVWFAICVAQAPDFYWGPDRDEYYTASTVQSVFAGLCCPTVPYIISMAVLGAIYFNLKSSPPSP